MCEHEMKLQTVQPLWNRVVNAKWKFIMVNVCGKCGGGGIGQQYVQSVVEKFSSGPPLEAAS